MAAQLVFLRSAEASLVLECHASAAPLADGRTAAPPAGLPLPPLKAESVAIFHGRAA